MPGLFGGFSQPQINQPITDMGATPLAPPIQVPKPRGLFGSGHFYFQDPEQMQSPNLLSRFGAILQDTAAGAQGQPGGYSQQLMKSFKDRRQMQQIRDQLPEQLKPVFDAAPDLVMQRLSKTMLPDAPEYQAFDNGGVFNKQTGKWDQPNQPKTEFGWTRSPDGSLSPIKGGPADPAYKQQVNPKAFVINTGVGAGGGLSQDGLDLAAQQYRMTQTLPPLGMGSAAAGLRMKVINRAAELAKAEGNDAEATVLDAAGYKANSQALNQLAKQRTMVGSFEKTFHKNIDVMEKLLPKVGQGGMPVANRWINAGRRAVAGDPDVAAFNTALQTVQAEYAKIMSGSMGNTPISDSARHHAEELINSAQTPQQLAAVIKVLRQDAQNRMSGFEEEGAQLRKTMSGDKPKADLKFNPATGKLERQ